MSILLDVEQFESNMPKYRYKSQADTDAFLKQIKHCVDYGSPSGLKIHRMPTEGRVELSFEYMFDPNAPEPSENASQAVEDEKQSVESNLRLDHQVQALRWLQGRTSDQFVTAWIQMEIESMERAGGTPERS